MSLVTVHGPNTMYTDAPGVITSTPAGAQATQDATNGLKFTFTLSTGSTRADQDFSWAFPPNGTPSPQAVKSPTQVTYGTAGAKTATLTVSNTARTVTNKVLTSNVATLTSNGHGFLVGQTVVVAGVDATFNGTYVITAVTANTFSYAKTNADVGTAAATGTATPSGLTPAAGTYTMAVTAVSGMPKGAEAEDTGDATGGVSPESAAIQTAPDTSGSVGNGGTAMVEEEYDPYDHTVAEVMAEANSSNDPAYIEELISAEQAGKNRVTLVGHLQDYLATLE
jgi:hypothetical protein